MKNLCIIFFAKCSGLEKIADVKIKRTNRQLSGLPFYMLWVSKPL